jgi:hypothetical protein
MKTTQKSCSGRLMFDNSSQIPMIEICSMISIPCVCSGRYQPVPAVTPQDPQQGSAGGSVEEAPRPLPPPLPASPCESTGRLTRQNSVPVNESQLCNDNDSGTMIQGYKHILPERGKCLKSSRTCLR